MTKEQALELFQTSYDHILEVLKIMKKNPERRRTIAQQGTGRIAISFLEYSMEWIESESFCEKIQKGVECVWRQKTGRIKLPKSHCL